MCGKDQRLQNYRLHALGSPPHVRERQTSTIDAMNEIRITPACAGKTLQHVQADGDYWDHPRMCGKDLITLILSTVRCRITPACAGKTSPCLQSAWPSWDHPRMCGKDELHDFLPVSLAGSPPHVRERLDVCMRPPVKKRITPACAGKTRQRGQPVRHGWDHPRMCGKDHLTPVLTPRLQGSPPHVRERLKNVRSWLDYIGITPACAGKTPNNAEIRSVEQDHPRMCGKDALCHPHSIRTEGSPPHVRERHSVPDPKRTGTGITPACAGKTAVPGIRDERHWDHPRMCGKDAYMICTSRASARITPACAGKT